MTFWEYEFHNAIPIQKAIPCKQVEQIYFYQYTQKNTYLAR